MATRFLTRSLLTKQTLNSIFSRSFSSLSLPKPQSASATTLSILRFRPLVAVAAGLRDVSLPPSRSVRGFATRQTTSSLNDPNPNWSNRPPKETILLDGCDFEHWLVVVEKPDENMTRDDIIDSYIKLLAGVVGSEEEARMKIYSVSTKHYFAFGALVSEELSYKIKELPGVRWVLPDSYLDVRNKDYGGEPFINGQAVPYDPKYHEEWVRNNARANDRNRRNQDRPRNHDRSRNFDRRREMDMHRQNVQNSGGQTFAGGPQNTGSNNPGYVPPNNMGGGTHANPQYVDAQQSRGAPYQSGPGPNQGYVPPNNMGGGTHTNPQHVDAQHSRGAPYQSGPGLSQNSYASNTSGGHPSQNNYLGGMPMPNHPPNPQHGHPSNSGGAPYQSGPGPNPNMAGGNPYQNNHMAGMPSNVPYNGAPPYQSGPAPNQNSYGQNTGGGNPYQNQNMPGRDVPPPHNNY